MFLWYNLYIANIQGYTCYMSTGAGVFRGNCNLDVIFESFIFALFSPFILIWTFFLIIKENLQ